MSATHTPSISAIPIGLLPDGLLSWLVKHLSEIVERQVIPGDMVQLPPEAYNSQRGQYLGEALLAVLNAHPNHVDGQALGLIDADCYAPGLDYILGVADPGLRAAIVALPRLRQSFLGLPDDESIFRQRVLKEAVYELGQTWGLDHCADPHCVMYFSSSQQDIDAKNLDLCPSCLSRLKRQP